MAKRTKGLFLDSDEIDQPEGTYSDAQNALLSKKIGAIVSEEGNEFKDNFTDDYSIIGSTLIYDGRTILFIVDNGNSEIGIFDGETYSTVINDSRLNFQEGSVVEATTRIDNNGDVIVYWTDDINPPRYLNVDNPTSPIENINILNIFNFVDSVPQIDLDSVNQSGGSLNTGAYFFFVAYIDEDGNRTNYLSTSQPVYITDDNDLSATDEYDGAPANTPTGKSISIDITNIDSNYERLEVAVLARENGTTRYVRRLPDINISNDSVNVTYTGTESFTDGSLDDIIVNNASYETARTLTQIDNILYLGNLTRRPDIGYQRFANNIGLEVDSQELSNGEDDGNNNYKSSEISYDFKGYKRDEVYAFYISFVLNDGSETTAYHIPGREPIDEEEVDDVSNYPTELSEENLIDSDNGKRFQFENRSDESPLNTGYWENQGETYPDSDDWDVYDVDGNGNETQVGSLREDQVRHHRMPSLRHFPYNNEFGDFISIGVKLSNLKIPDSMIDEIKGVKLYYANRVQGNKRILGQSFIYNIISGPVDESDEEFYFPSQGSGGVTNSFGSSGFKMLKDRPSIGEFTHIKIAGYPQGQLTDVFDDGNNDYDLYDLTFGNTLNQGNYAFGNIGVTDSSNEGNEITIQFDGTPNDSIYEVNIDVDGSESNSELANKIATAINNDSNIEEFYDANISLSDDSVVEIEAEDGGSHYNATIDIVQDDGANLFSNDIANGKDTGINLAVDGAAKAYVPSGQEVVELQSKGFSNDGHTGYSESGMWFELINDYDYVVDPIPRNVTGAGHVGIISDIMSHQLNLYNSFDVQEIVDTGFYSTDIDNFDPTDGGSTFETDSIFGGDTYINRYGFRISNDQVSSVNHKSIFFHICESYDNIDLRHEGTEYEEIYYPKSSAQDVLELEEEDDTDEFYDNFYGYNIDYSALQDIKTAIPYSKEGEGDITSLPTRVIRSQQDDPTEEIDRFRQFLENDFIDLPRNRGELVTLSTAENMLLPHMERGLFRTKGREELVTGDIRAYVGAGDIFSVRPDEINPTEEGFGGLQDQVCAMTTPYGYFFVDRQAGQILLMNQGINVISDSGLRNFFEEQLTQVTDENQLICSWDNRFERIILTLKEGTNEYPDGWTLSYYPTLKAWGSFHSYIPDYYFSTVETFYSSINNNIYRHNDKTSSCNFYGEDESFIFEFVDNRSPSSTKYLVNIEYISEIIDSDGNKDYDATFDQFRINNNYQDSGLQDITYFTGTNGNARHVEGTWKINKFRDMLVNGEIDPNKEWFNQSRFIGKYGKVRLIYNNSDNNFLYLYDTKINMKRSYR